MDGLCRALGSPAGVRLSGHTYLCRPMTLGRFAAIEAFLLCQQPSNPEAVAMAASTASPRLMPAYRMLMDEAVRRLRENKSERVAPFDIVRAWISEPAGIAHTAWLCLRRCPFARTPERAEAHFRDHHGDSLAFVRTRDCISGIDLAGSMDWPAPFLYPPGHPKAGQPVERPRPKFFPWKKIIHGLANKYQIPKSSIASLTLYELRYWSLDEDDPALGGTASISRDDERRLRRMTSEERRRHLQTRGPTRGD